MSIKIVIKISIKLSTELKFYLQKSNHNKMKDFGKN